MTHQVEVEDGEDDYAPADGRANGALAMTDRKTATGVCDSLAHVSGSGGGGEPAARSASDDIRICYHEASHAGVGRQLHATALGGCTVEAGPDYSGLTWGPAYVRRTKFSDAPSLCSQLAGVMPQVGESRADCADLYLHCFHRVVELVAGTEGERLFCDGEPWFAADDERQAFALASLVTSSPAAAAAFIEFARVEAVSLLTASAHIVRALAAELRFKRTMDGAAIDRCIERAVAIRAAEIEAQRRADWRERQASAARLVTLKP
jgi:hypothetical protein